MGEGVPTRGHSSRGMMGEGVLTRGHSSRWVGVGGWGEGWGVLTRGHSRHTAAGGPHALLSRTPHSTSAQPRPPPPDAGPSSRSAHGSTGSTHGSTCGSTHGSARGSTGPTHGSAGSASSSTRDSIRGLMGQNSTQLAQYVAQLTHTQLNRLITSQLSEQTAELTQHS